MASDINSRIMEAMRLVGKAKTIVNEADRTLPSEDEYLEYEETHPDAGSLEYGLLSDAVFKAWEKLGEALDQYQSLTQIEGQVAEPELHGGVDGGRQ